VSFDAGPIRHAYEAIAEEYVERFGDDLAGNELDGSVITAAVDRMAADARVVDVGCGPGQMAAFLAERGRRAVGVDLAPAMLRLARQRHPGLPLVHGDLLRLPLRPGRLDGVVAWYSLHNLPRALLPDALAELRRVLRPGGMLLIATHGGRAEDYFEQRWDGRVEQVVLTYYELGELIGVVGRAGFRVELVRRRAPMDHELRAEKLFLRAAAD
jgi:ubiquinone/menaquinone biosynthesis C-methylase UbiE